MASVCIVFFLAGYFANTLLTPKQVQAQVQGDRVYKVVLGSEFSPDFAATLNSAANGGWRIVPMHVGGGLWIFEK
jgi:hypothetical protein